MLSVVGVVGNQGNISLDSYYKRVALLLCGEQTKGECGRRNTTQEATAGIDGRDERDRAESFK